MVSPFSTLDAAALAASAAFALAALAEWLHARRVRRVSGLAFGAAARPRAWAAAAAPARVVAATAMAWGAVILLSADAREAPAPNDGEPRHLVIALDVSPSMTIPDAGPQGGQTRADRARDVLRSLLARVDRARLRVSVIAFYSGAMPVVVDTTDPEVVGNVLADLPLEFAFEVGKTRMYDGVAAAAELGKAWRPGSAAFVMVSDGDTLPASAPPALPPAFSGTLVIGVGDCARGTMIADHASAQDAVSLRELASRLGGRYHDGNAHHLPSASLAGFAAAAAGPVRRDLADAALAALAIGAAIEALLPFALRTFGAPASPRHRRVAADRPSSSVSSDPRHA